MNEMNGYEVYDFLMKNVNENLTNTAATQQNNLSKQADDLIKISPYMIKIEMEEVKDDYGLCGCELTLDDAEAVVDLIYRGFPKERAIASVLDSIAETLIFD